MSSRIVATLFEIWLLACNKVFPSPSLWKTFQEFCSSWRHHISVVVEWNRVCFAITNRLIELTINNQQSISSSTNQTQWFLEQTNSLNLLQSNTFSASTRSNTIPSSSSSSLSLVSDTNASFDIQAIINQMSIETVIQTWFRFMHIIGRPIDFCDSHAIAKSLDINTKSTQRLTQNINKENSDVTASANTINNYPCLKKLPFIFLEVMKGVSKLVDLYLLQPTIRISQINPSTTASTTSAINNMSVDQRLRSKTVYSDSGISTNSTVSGLSVRINDSQPFRINIYKQNRPCVNSILHLFGHWLFDAAIRQNSSNESRDSTTGSLNSNRDFVLGQAEAYGILCRIFCSVKTNEQILPEYLSRFYALIINGLRNIASNLGNDLNQQMEYESGEILASILVNGHNLFKCDLEGVNILLLPMLNVLNAIFKLKYVQKEDQRVENRSKEIMRTVFNIGSSSVSLIELKKYCIHIFSSLLSVPNHFNTLNIGGTGGPGEAQYFSLKSKMLEIFLAAMTNEHDTNNLQMLFGCGKLIVGEWSLDENRQRNSSSSTFLLDKKERASYCYNQIVTLILAPLRINNQSTLQNHLFALCIFDSLASIVAGDFFPEQSKSNYTNSNEEESVSKLAISWIWHYVKVQIKRRSKEHTKEMHSVIVAAYNCLIMLLITKPSLLRDKNCLQTVANCIEIGISGSSSYPEQQKVDGKENNQNSNHANNSSSNSSNNSNNTASSATLKADKELRPASLRVKEAAEIVLYFLMEHTSAQNLSSSLNSFEDAIRTPLDEKSILDITSKENTRNKFKYYALDGSLIMGILEKPLLKSNVSKVSPTVTVLLRGPFGQQAYSLHLRPSPYSKLEQIKDIKFNMNPKGPHYFNSNRSTLKALDSNLTDLNNFSLKYENNNNYDDRAPRCESFSVPSLNQVAEKYCRSLQKFQEFKYEQIDYETSSIDRAVKESMVSFARLKTNLIDDLSLKVKKCSDFQSARVLFSNLGYCSLDVVNISYKGQKDDSLPTEILNLDSATDYQALQEHLFALDRLPIKTFSTCYVFYVKKNQSNVKAILNNINLDCQLDESFYIFIQSLGSIINANNINNSNNSSNSTDTNSQMARSRKLNKINGVENIVYWSDVLSEISFIVPNGVTSQKASDKQERPRSDSSPHGSPLSAKNNNNSPSNSTQINLNLDERLKSKYHSVPSDLKCLIIWLEQLQDADNIPIEELIQETCLFDNQSQSNYNKPKEIIVIFIHPLENKLNRIIIWSNTNKK
jgi:hypothetical protein